jgi:hypothetical protein
VSVEEVVELHGGPADGGTMKLPAIDGLRVDFVHVPVLPGVAPAGTAEAKYVRVSDSAVFVYAEPVRR